MDCHGVGKVRHRGKSTEFAGADEHCRGGVKQRPEWKSEVVLDRQIYIEQVRIPVDVVVVVAVVVAEVVRVGCGGGDGWWRSFWSQCCSWKEEHLDGSEHARGASKDIE